MNEKIKKFYRDHKEDIIIGAFVLGGYAILTTAYIIDLRRIGGYQVKGVGTNFTSEIPKDGSVIVHLMNGKEIYFSPPAE